ncbi:hypothetical protein [Paraburkholderia fynbosensis]|nr:hypothetical protein [Paraburkholderia fynbosensis]
MVEFLKDYYPDLLGEHDFKFNYSQEARRLPQILEGEHVLFRRVWYNRHWNLRHELETGKHHVVAEKDYSRNPYRADQTLDTVWEGALAAAKRTEDEVGIENLGPWDDFEWGMINGKLSSLRWILGDVGTCWTRRCLNQASKKRTSFARSSSSFVKVVRSDRVDTPM